MIFQDPYASLNPRMRVEEIIGEAPLVHGLVAKAEQPMPTSIRMLRSVGLDPDFRRRYPHQFSGGQRSRIGIARALAVKPEFLVCDEAVAALDVSIQAQVINLFMDLSARSRSHVSVHQPRSRRRAAHLRPHRDHVSRPHRRKRADGGVLRRRPIIPTPRRCLRRFRASTSASATFHPIKGEIPSPIDPPPGCHFHPRCPHAFERCRIEVPQLKEIAPGRMSACHFNDG